jgi:hypothetical protein
MSGAIPPLSKYAFMAWCSVKKKHRDNFTFHLFCYHENVGCFNSNTGEGYFLCWYCCIKKCNEFMLGRQNGFVRNRENDY